MEQSVSKRAGTRLRNLRIALGFNKRPEFAAEIGCSYSRLQNLENLNGRLNEEDFYRIGKRWPWALEYLAVGGDLIIPEGVDAPAAKVGHAISNVVTTADTLPVNSLSDPTAFLTALTSNPELKEAFQNMIKDMLQHGMDSKE